MQELRMYLFIFVFIDVFFLNSKKIMKCESPLFHVYFPLSLNQHFFSFNLLAETKRR